MFRSALLVPVCCVALAAQSAVPFCQVAGAPNPRFEAELDTAIKALAPAERRAFFKELRTKQRELQVRIFEVERGLQQAQSLRNTLEREASPNLSQAQSLVVGQSRMLEDFRELDRVIARQRWAEDPLKLDADELKVDLYGGFQFSSLFSEGGADRGSFFSKSRPFVAPGHPADLPSAGPGHLVGGLQHPRLPVFELRDLGDPERDHQQRPLPG